MKNPRREIVASVVAVLGASFGGAGTGLVATCSSS
jgi:hypothetical protein